MPSALRARDPRTAARSAVLILAVCAAALAGLTVAAGPTAGAFLTSWSGVAVLFVGAAVCRFVPAGILDRIGVCVVLALGGVLLTSTLNFLTSDTTITGQSFLAFPVLWAASHLRRGAVVLATGIAVVADALTLFLLSPSRALRPTSCSSARSWWSCSCGPTRPRSGWLRRCRSRPPSTR